MPVRREHGVSKHVTWVTSVSGDVRGGGPSEMTSSSASDAYLPGEDAAIPRLPGSDAAVVLR